MLTEKNNKTEILKLSVDLVSAYARKNEMTRDELVPFVERVFSSMLRICEGSPLMMRNPNLKPAVPIEESVHDNYIICLEDGKKLQMLKRHLKSMYNMTVEQYKERWGLPHEYPVVSPDYAKRRSAIAKSSGLGQAGRRRRMSVAA